MASVPSPDPPHRRTLRTRAGLALGRWLRRTPLLRRAPSETVAPALVGSLSIRPPWALLTRLRLWRRRPGRPAETTTGPYPPELPGVPGPGALARVARAHRPDPLRLHRNRRPPIGHRPGPNRPEPLIVRADLDLPVAPVLRTPVGVGSPEPPAPGSADGPVGPVRHRPVPAPGPTPASPRPPLGRQPVAAHGPGVAPGSMLAAAFRRDALPRTAADGVAHRSSPGGAAHRSPAGVPGPGRLAGIAAGQAAALVTRPPAGPSVRPPYSASELPVLGAGVAAPGTMPDPTGAVQVTAPPRPAFASAPPGTVTRAAVGAGSTGGGTPRQRWESAVAAHPLEAPRPLPSALHALARSITGRSGTPRFTTGPATRHALAAAGALGATTGSVVHLAAVPTGRAAAAVLAHELAHTRQPVRRPRFLLAGGAGLLDDDERQAVATGRDLLAGNLPDAAGDTIAAGIVDRLPVGGGLGAVRELVTQTTHAVIEAMPQLPGAVPGMDAGPAGAYAGLPTVSGPLGPGAEGPVPGDPARPDGNGGSTGGSTPAGGGTPAGAAAGGTPSPDTPLDPDRVVEIVEERLLREIERRGGRWAGVF
ncbi:DUF4157 domain-containing protein [Plantactinospora solaniradicis]|uniref:DUF4157 domain-containing protein n=1 Tax=Plantactinospora solaniradicis TaxID=1723736 RepID=A0ABW1K3H0_9ACTN